MKHYREKWDNVTFLVFSDNILWCRRQSLFATDDVHIMKGHSTVTQDLAMMSACNGVILSMGTFGWWAGHFRVEIQIYVVLALLGAYLKRTFVNRIKLCDLLMLS